MIFHFSMDADDPQGVAQALAALWSCEAYPFPPIGQGSWIVIADDERGSGIEVYPRGVVLKPGQGDEAVEGETVPTTAPANVAMHFAIATTLSEDAVYALGARQGWRTVRQNRGGRFHVIELWVENRVMLEVLTAEMQAEYLATSNAREWREMLDARRAA